MKLTLACVVVLSVIPITSMAENASNYGTVTFTGSVVDTPCNIKQDSLNQTVSFGQLSRKSLEKGNQAEAKFKIEFFDCDLASFNSPPPPSGGGEGNTRSLKSMHVTFTSQDYVDADASLAQTSPDHNNNLGIAISGFKFGVAKDLTDAMINPIGDNTLSFIAITKAIDVSKPVVEGNFSAITNFRIEYL